MFGLTLRKGSREYFYKALDNCFAGFKEKYQFRFGEQYECLSTDYKALMETFTEQCVELGIDNCMQFYQPEVYVQQSLF